MSGYAKSMAISAVAGFAMLVGESSAAPVAGGDPGEYDTAVRQIVTNSQRACGELFHLAGPDVEPSIRDFLRVDRSSPSAAEDMRLVIANKGIAVCFTHQNVADLSDSGRIREVYQVGNVAEKPALGVQVNPSSEPGGREGLVFTVALGPSSRRDFWAKCSPAEMGLQTLRVAAQHETPATLYFGEKGCAVSTTLSVYDPPGSLTKDGAYESHIHMEGAAHQSRTEEAAQLVVNGGAINANTVHAISNMPTRSNSTSGDAMWLPNTSSRVMPSP